MKRFLKTWVRSLVLAGVGLLMVSLVSPGGVSAQTTNPLAVVDALLKAMVDDKNVEAALALVTDDAVFSIVPPPPNTPGGVWTGKEQIRQYLEFSIMQDIELERVGSAKVEGDKVTMTVMVLVNDFRQWGIGAVEHTYDAVVQGGKIKSFTFIMAPAERGRVAAAANAYFASHPPTGMPSTGGGQYGPFSLLIALGMLAMLVGLSLRRSIKAKVS